VKLETAKNNKRKANDSVGERPVGTKAAKDALQEEKKARKAVPPATDSASTDPHHQFVAAFEKKARIMQQQLHFNIFMQDPESAESIIYFAAQRKAILAQLALANAEPAALDAPVALEAPPVRQVHANPFGREDSDNETFQEHDHEPTQIHPMNSDVEGDEDIADNFEEDLRDLGGNDVVI
jgi:hypothetical protein